MSVSFLVSYANVVLAADRCFAFESFARRGWSISLPVSRLACFLLHRLRSTPSTAKRTHHLLFGALRTLARDQCFPNRLLILYGATSFRREYDFFWTLAYGPFTKRHFIRSNGSFERSRFGWSGVNYLVTHDTIPSGIYRSGK